MIALDDAAAREAIRFDFEHTLIVEAAAGTGKTTELVRRMLGLISSGNTTLARIVAVTFTEKAAAEMKLRLRAEIERARRTPEIAHEVRTRLDAALTELEAAHISTIHAFCSELLHEWPIESRVDPLFETADEQRQERLYDEAFERWFQGVLAHPPEGVRRLLRRKAEDDGGAREALRRAGLQIVQQRDFDAPWRRDPFPREAAIDTAVQDLAAVGALARLATNVNNSAAKSIAEIDRYVADLTRREALRGRDYDGLEAELRALTRGKRSNFWRSRGSGKYFGPGLLRTDVLAQRDAAKSKLDAMLSRADADLAACLREDLRSLVIAYEKLKARAGVLDFLDLLLLACRLVRDRPDVRREVQSRFSHFMVDEFQDTDPLQAELLLLLTADDPAENDFAAVTPLPGKLFVVGDPKQAIYRFRRADVTLYETIKDRLLTRGAKLANLTTSFRSVPSIQSAINAAFAPHMTGSSDGSQPNYVALNPFRAEPADRPTIIALPVPKPYSEWGNTTDRAIDASLPDAIGGFVDWLLGESGWKVSERERAGELVPVAPRHVCLLSRRFVNFRDDVTRPYVRALEARRIPHVLVGGRSFHAREEIIAMRNALNAIEWPDDEFSVFASLRGPFFALGDDALLAFRTAHGGLHPLKAVPSEMLDELTQPVADGLQLLGSLHVQRNRRPIASTIAGLLEETRAHAGVAMWPSGEQALANLLRVLDRARRFEAGGATSFRAFVRTLDEEAERGDAEEAPIVEEGTDGVRIMTVHKAKGLEFPIVILIDPTDPLVRREPSRYVDSNRSLWASPLAGCVPTELLEHREEIVRHDRDEAVRVAYVAATRAREMLVIPVLGDNPSPSGATLPEDATWLDIFGPVLFPPSQVRRRTEAAPGCPRFGEDSVVHRPAKVRATVDGAVKPGLHRATLGEHVVVWWDPGALQLEREEDVGLRYEWVLYPEPSGTATGTEKEYDGWRARRERVRRDGAVPRIRIRSVTEQKSEIGAPNVVPVMLEMTDAVRTRLVHGKRFGSLVHATLAVVEFGGDARAVRAIASSQGRMLGASPEEIVAAGEAVISALRHPLLTRAANAPDCRRETPVVLVLPEDGLIEGVFDLAFREAQEHGMSWTVVDFKTDAEIEARRSEYERQVGLYARALAAATGEAVEAYLLQV